MLPDFTDITSRIAEPPIWYSEGGVPRYEPFSPRHLGVYDHYGVLYEIECQACGKHIQVGRGLPHYGFVRHDDVLKAEFYSLQDLLSGSGFGDPPQHGCVGDTMTSIDTRIVEAWSRETGPWIRHHDAELDFAKPEWAVAQP